MYFDVECSKVVTNYFMLICVTKRRKQFEAIEKVFSGDSATWCNCVSLSIDNTYAMMGKKSVASNFTKKNNEIFLSGDFCHLPQ